MKCFNGTEIGISFTNDEKLGDVVLLGEPGRGRTLTRVKLDARAMPVVQRDDHGYGVVLQASLVSFSPPPNDPRRLAPTFWTLKAPKTGDARAVVRVCTCASYTRGTYGRSSALIGEPKKTAEGAGAHGDAGRIGGWTDTLWVMAPGDVVFVSPEGGHKVSPYVLSYDGERVVRQNYDDFLAEVSAAPAARKAQLRVWAEKYESKRLLAACDAVEASV